MPVIDMVAKIPASYYIAVKWQKRFNDKIKYVFFTLIDYNPPTRNLSPNSSYLATIP